MQDRPMPGKPRPTWKKSLRDHKPLDRHLRYSRFALAQAAAFALAAGR